MSAKVLIVDPSTPGLSQLKDACQDDVLFVTYVAPQHFEEGEEDVEHLHDSQPIPTDLKELCKDATNVGLVWANPAMQSIPFSGFEEMLHDNLVVDLITCNLGKDDFPERMQALEAQHTNLQIRYSLDKTANPNQGGDWIMESHNASIKPVFFTDKLSLYKYSLDIVVCHLKYVASTAEFAITSTTTLITETKECSKVTFTGDINWPYNHVLTMDQHAENSALIIEGVTGNKITICNDSDSNAYNGLDYKGIIRNGAAAITGQGGTITGLNVVSVNVGGSEGMFGGSSGGIVQSHANRLQSVNTLTISNCTVKANVVGISTGGICGRYAGANNGSCVVTQCSLTGNVAANSAGGICGYGACFDGGSCVISQCSVTGNVAATGAGGICGNSASIYSGTCVITQCSLTGNVAANSAGGICGTDAGSGGGSCVISQCSVTGTVAGVLAGGICGENTLGTCVITNCYLDGPTTVVGNGAANIDECWFSVSSATDATLTNVNLSAGLVKLNVDRPTLSITGATLTSYNQDTIAPPGTGGDAGTDFLSLGDAFTSYDHDTDANTDNVPWPSSLISAPGGGGGGGGGGGEGSGGAAGDPFIQPIFGKLYEIPNTINHYRMVEGDDLIVNASYRYFTPKEKTAIRNYYYRVTGDMIGINSLVVDGGVAQNKAFIQCEGITLTYDYDTKHVCASQNVEYSIEDRVDGKSVVFTFPHSKYGKVSVDCRHYINPQAFSGIFVTIQRKARECVGLLIRNYNSIPFIVNSETDTTSKKSIAKSAEHYEAPKSLLKNVTRS